MEKGERSEVERLAGSTRCPRCDMDKLAGAGLCRACLSKLPEHMRKDLERIDPARPHHSLRALRAAANYFDLHFRSLREFFKKSSR